MSHEGDESVRYEWDESRGPSVAVVEGVAALTNRRPIELPPLHRTVDADALDMLLTAKPARTVRVSFDFDGCSVTVDGDGSVEIRATDGRDD
jgi:hypothetical protein